MNQQDHQCQNTKQTFTQQTNSGNLKFSWFLCPTDVHCSVLPPTDVGSKQANVQREIGKNLIEKAERTKSGGRFPVNAAGLRTCVRNKRPSPTKQEVTPAAVQQL